MGRGVPPGILHAGNASGGWPGPRGHPSQRSLAGGKAGDGAVPGIQSWGHRLGCLCFSPALSPCRVCFLPWFLSFWFCCGQWHLWAKRLGHVHSRGPRCRQARGAGVWRGHIGLIEGFSSFPNGTPVLLVWLPWPRMSRGHP